MFRPMKKLNQQLSEEECIELLKSEKRGVLSVIGDDDYPYGIPLDFWYDENEKNIYFHGSSIGHKIDAIKKCDKVSFCIYIEDSLNEKNIGLMLKSVIVFGRIQIVKDKQKTIDICRNLNKKFNFNNETIDEEISKYTGLVAALELMPEYISGKVINEECYEIVE